MFPLGTVLFPGAVLPLHVFEARYRALVEHCLQGQPEFGVVLIERGSEVGGGDVRSALGTVARIVEVGRFDDGRYALMTVGTRRIDVLEWLPDDPYPIAEIVERTDTGEIGADRLSEALEPVVGRLRRVLALAAELGAAAAPATVELATDPALAVFHACALAPLGPTDQYRLLGIDDPIERLRVLDVLLGDAEELLRFRLGAAGMDDSEP
jgi:Lon protease-like protein